MDRYYGVYRGTVVDVDDPLAMRRVRVMCPSIGGELGWASPCLPPGASTGSYRIDDSVWIAFEAGDVSSPVVLGKSR